MIAPTMAIVAANASTCNHTPFNSIETLFTKAWIVLTFAVLTAVITICIKDEQNVFDIFLATFGVTIVMGLVWSLLMIVEQLIMFVVS